LPIEFHRRERRKAVEEPRALQDRHQTRKTKNKKGQNQKTRSTNHPLSREEEERKKGRCRNHSHSRTDKEGKRITDRISQTRVVPTTSLAFDQTTCAPFPFFLCH
jgi:hypothetical protein